MATVPTVAMHFGSLHFRALSATVAVLDRRGAYHQADDVVHVFSNYYTKNNSRKLVSSQQNVLRSLQIKFT